MPLDPSIILDSKPIQIDNPVDIATKALNLKDLAAQSQMKNYQLQQAQAIRGAYQGASTTDENGNTSIDPQKALSNLIKADPAHAMEYQTAAQTASLATQQNHIAQRQAGLQSIPTGPGVDPNVQQDSWTKMIAAQKAAGMDVSMYTPQYPGDQGLQAMQVHLLSAKDQAEMQEKQLELQNKAKELDFERYKTVGGPLPGGGSAPQLFGQGGGAPQGAASQGGRTPGSQTYTPAATPQGGAPAGAQGKPALSSIDPSDLVRSHLPPAQQEKAFEEIKDRQNIARIYDKSLAAFDQAAKEQHPIQTALSGEMPSATSLNALMPDHIPFLTDSEKLTASQKIFRGLANTTIKEVEGTSKQAAMQSLEDNYMPQSTDSAQTIATKRAGWLNYLESHSSAPVTHSAGIDLDKFASTNLANKNAAKSSPQPAPGADHSLADLLAEKAARQKAKMAGQ